MTTAALVLVAAAACTVADDVSERPTPDSTPVTLTEPEVGGAAGRGAAPDGVPPPAGEPGPAGVGRDGVPPRPGGSDQDAGEGSRAPEPGGPGLGGPGEQPQLLPGAPGRFIKPFPDLDGTDRPDPPDGPWGHGDDSDTGEPGQGPQLIPGVPGNVEKPIIPDGDVPDDSTPDDSTPDDSTRDDSTPDDGPGRGGDASKKE